MNPFSSSLPPVIVYLALFHLPTSGFYHSALQQSLSLSLSRERDIERVECERLLYPGRLFSLSHSLLLSLSLLSLSLYLYLYLSSLSFSLSLSLSHLLLYLSSLSLSLSHCISLDLSLPLGAAAVILCLRLCCGCAFLFTSLQKFDKTDEDLSS